MRFRSGLKRRLDSFSTGYVQIIDLYFHPSCCPFDLIQHFGVFGLKDSHTGERGNNLLQKLDFFSAHLRFKCRQPSDIPLRSRQAGNETVANWSVVLAHHNGNRDACRLDSTGGRRSGGNYGIELQLYKFNRKHGTRFGFPSADRHSMTMFFPSM